MFENGKYQMDLTKRIAFNRIAGTVDELNAAKILQSEIETTGGTSKLEKFEIPGWEISEARLTIVEPFVRSIEVTGIGRSGSVDVIAPLIYLEEGSEVDFSCDVHDKIVLLNRIDIDIWKRLVNSGALAYLLIDGDYNDQVERVDLKKNYLRDYMLCFGKVPGLTMRTADAIEMLRDGASHVKVELAQSEAPMISQNVIAEIPGTDSDEIIVFTAHYDSVPYSNGAWDNASGSADLMALYLWYKENPPKRTLRFIWCGSEERGLLGSLAYVREHKNELDRIQFGINIDMTGPILGFDRAIVTADEGLITMLEYLSHELGHSIKVNQAPHASDSTPFSDAGVPTISFHRAGRAIGHSRYDLITPLGAEAFAKTWNFIRAFSDKIVNSSLIPVPRTIPQNMKDEIDKYFHREK